MLMSNCKPWKVTSIHFQLSKNTQLKGNIHRVYLKPTGIFQVLLKLWIATKGPNLYWLYIPFSWKKRKQCSVFFSSIEMLKIQWKKFLPISLSQHTFFFLCLSHNLSVHYTMSHQEREKYCRWRMGPSGRRWSIQAGHWPSTWASRCNHMAVNYCHYFPKVP